MSSEGVPPVIELDRAQTAPVPAPAALDGRRRPGRLAEVNPRLVPLLRNAAHEDVPTVLLTRAERSSLNEDLSMARGFGLGLLLAIPAWGAIGFVAWALLR